jgi:phage terminase small subunit
MKPGPKPQPSNVHYLHGNPSKKPAGELLEQFRPDIELPKCPRFLNLKGAGLREAKAEYLRLGEELVRYGLVSKVDRGHLAAIAVEWGLYVWAMEKIAAANQADEAGEKGLIERTATGYRKFSVYLEIKNRALDNYHRLAMEFGLTPSARTRVTPGADTPQIPLPGVEPAPGAPTLRSFA